MQFGTLSDYFNALYKTTGMTSMCTCSYIKFTFYILIVINVMKSNLTSSSFPLLNPEISVVAKLIKTIISY